MSEAIRRGFAAMRPSNRGCPFDVFINFYRRCARVQVKSTARRALIKQKRLAYHFQTRHRDRCYKLQDFEFYALYIVARDIWYIVPHRDVLGKKLIEVRPDNPGHYYERYREAWHLLRRPPGPRRTGLTIYACIEEPSPSVDTSPETVLTATEPDNQANSLSS